MDEGTKFALKAIGILILIIVIVWGIFMMRSSSRYNNGVCPECGGRYIYQQAVGHWFTTDYVYICNGCGKMIAINYYVTSVEKHQKGVH